MDSVNSEEGGKNGEGEKRKAHNKRREAGPQQLQLNVELNLDVWERVASHWCLVSAQEVHFSQRDTSWFDLKLAWNPRPRLTSQAAVYGRS